MKSPAVTRLGRNVHRTGDIIAVLAKYGLADWVKGLDFPWIQDRLRSVDGQHIPNLKIEERVRLACTELGTTFIKLGQMLGTRPDLVGPQMAVELSHLQVAVPADSPATVQATITAEFGKPPSVLFAYFEEQPLASASIAQVHVARLLTGEDVVVKVQHAGIEDKIIPDLDILADLAEWAEKHSAPLRHYQPAAVVRQLRRTLQRELDFTFERRNLAEFAKNFAEDETVHFPRAYAAFSTRRVLTMEKLDGILGTDTAALAESGTDLSEVARRGATIYMQMIFRDAFYHADPHPGNLMLLADGVIGILDCGMVGRLDDEMKEDLNDMLIAVVNQNSVDLEEVILRVGSVPSAAPSDLLRADLADFIGDYVGHSFQDVNVSAALNNLFEIIRRHNITLPVQLTMLLRMVVELEGTARQFAPEFNMAEVIQPFCTTAIHRRQSIPHLVDGIRHSYDGWERLAVSLPRDLNELLRRVRKGTFSFQLDHRHILPAVNRLVLGLVASALLVSSSLLWSMKAPPMIKDVSVVGAAGYLAAAFLGWQVLRAVKKSGDIKSNQ